MLNIVLFGPPGAGKGTQSLNIINQYKLVHLSTGEMLRAEIAAETELGIRAKASIARGELADDQTMIGMIEHRLKTEKNTAHVFDGFPRTIAQAEALDALMSKLGQSVSGMISLQVAKELLLERLSDRGKNSGRPEDGNTDVIEKRINIYLDQTYIVKDYYLAQGKFRGIDGVGSIEDVFQRISNAITSF